MDFLPLKSAFCSLLILATVSLPKTDRISPYVVRKSFRSWVGRSPPSVPGLPRLMSKFGSPGLVPWGPSGSVLWGVRGLHTLWGWDLLGPTWLRVKRVDFAIILKLGRVVPFNIPKSGAAGVDVLGSRMRGAVLRFEGMVELASKLWSNDIPRDVVRGWELGGS